MSVELGLKILSENFNGWAQAHATGMISLAEFGLN